MKKNIPLIILLVSTLISCSRFEKLTGSGNLSSTDSNATSNTNAGNTPPSDNSGTDFGVGTSPTAGKVNLPYALMSANQMLTSMLNAVNVNPDANTKAEFGSRFAMLPDGNELELTNAPFLLSATSIAGSVCLEAYEKERRQAEADRVVYKHALGAGTPSALTDAQFNATVRTMARMFWGRNETAEELKALQQFRMEFVSDPANSALTAYGYWKIFISALCGAMLSSIDAITY